MATRTYTQLVCDACGCVVDKFAQTLGLGEGNSGTGTVPVSLKHRADVCLGCWDAIHKVLYPKAPKRGSSNFDGHDA